MDAPLTVRELMKAMDLNSPSVVQHHILQLEKNGYLKRNQNNPKDYVILGDPEKQVVYINKYGLAQCGRGGEMLDGNAIDQIPIASRLLKFPAKDAFIVEAKGNSMEPDIRSGDLIIAQMQNYAQDGDIIIASHDDEVLIKKYILKNNKVMLHSLNRAYKPFPISDDFYISGIVRNVLHYH